MVIEENKMEERIVPFEEDEIGGIKLNLGCGYAKLDGYINIDNRIEICPDVVCDILQGLPFEDNTFDMVRANDFLEHIPIGAPVVKAIEEIYRVLKPGGIFKSSTPDSEYGQAAFQDPYHISFWVENSWWYYSNDSARDLYGIKAKFDIAYIYRYPELETNARLYWLKVKAIAIK
jgi:predicted SAM-dependent methyltransferase